MVRRNYSGRSQVVMTIALIAVLAIGAGYACTKYIITPYFIGDEGSEPTGTGSEENDFSGSSIITDQQDTDIADQTGKPEDLGIEAVSSGNNSSDIFENSQKVNLYCIQFGSFSVQEGAQTTADSLKALDIDAIVIQNDGSYKVIGTPFTNEEKAREAMAKLKPVAGEDIFITTMEAWMK